MASSTWPAPEAPPARRPVARRRDRVLGRKLAPGYAFPLWHGFLALIAKISGADPEQVVVTSRRSSRRSLSSSPTRRAGRSSGERGPRRRSRAHRRAHLLRAWQGRHVHAPLAPETASRRLLVPAALRPRVRGDPDARRSASTVDRGGRLRARGRASDLRDLPVAPFAGFLTVRASGRGRDLRTGIAALAALAVPAALFMRLAAPARRRTRRPSRRSRGAAARARSRSTRATWTSARWTASASPPRCSSASGAVAVVGVLLFPLGAFARRGGGPPSSRRLARRARGAARPAALHDARRPRLDLAGARQRDSCPSRSRSRGMACSRISDRSSAARADRRNGAPGPDFRRLRRPALRAHRRDRGLPWSAAVGARRRADADGRRHEAPPGSPAALFLLPVIAWASRWTPPDPMPGGSLSPGLVEALRTSSEGPGGRVLRSGDELPHRA